MPMYVCIQERDVRHKTSPCANRDHDRPLWSSDFATKYPCDSPCNGQCDASNLAWAIKPCAVRNIEHLALHRKVHRTPALPVELCQPRRVERRVRRHRRRRVGHVAPAAPRCVAELSRRCRSRGVPRGVPKS
eukprot:358916-Chlamydomonas_euryale.AAC.6